MVPLFSNVYFDFYREDLRSYQLKRHSSWTSAILYAYLGEERAADDAFNPESIPVEVPDI